MRFFLNRPLLALALLVGLVGVASGAAYVVDKLVIRVDESGTAEEIQADINQQLHAQGVEGSAHVEKSDDRLRIDVRVKADSAKEIELEGLEGQHQRLEVRVEATGAPLGAEQTTLIASIAADEQIIAAPADQRAGLLEAKLREAGFATAKVEVTGDTMIVRIAN